MQVVAVVCILVGFGLGVYLWTTLPVDGILLAHVVIGVITTGLAILQALAIVARPQPDSKHRCAHFFYNTSLYSKPTGALIWPGLICN